MASCVTRTFVVQAFVQSPQSRSGVVGRILKHEQFPEKQLPILPPPMKHGSASKQVRTCRFRTIVSGGVVTEAGSGALSPLTQYFLETLIANGVPAFFTIVVFGFIATFISKSRRGSMEEDILKTDNPVAVLYQDLYGDQEQEPKFPMFGGYSGRDGKKKLPRNSGIPKLQYLKVTHLNRKYDSYDYSLSLATKSKASAAAAYRKISFSRALEKALPQAKMLPASSLRALQEAEEAFLSKGKKIMSDLQKRQTLLTRSVIDGELKRLGLKDAYELDPSITTIGKMVKDDVENVDTVNTTKTLDRETNVSSSGADKDSNDSKLKIGGTSVEDKRGGGGGGGDGFMKGMRMSKSDTATDFANLQELELEFVREVVRAVGPAHGPSVRTALLGDVAARGTGGLLLLALEDRPLTELLFSYRNFGVTEEEASSRRVFVTRFPGDAVASQVANLREEVTAIVRSAQKGDQALVVLQTGGGTVTGYGLAAAQLLRLKEAGLKLTIAVEQVAASGGYMMCCVADRIVASPFAVLGSIGVISDIPNVYERLKKEGIEFQTVTAGKYKRTLTPTKKVTQADFDKTKEDVEEILVLFRDFVAQNRPQLDIDKIATGETWFGTAALERKLCDEIKTVDDVIMEFVSTGHNVYEVRYSPPPTSGFLALFPDTSEFDEDVTSAGPLSRVLQRSVRWVTQAFLKEVSRAALVGESSAASLFPGPNEQYWVEDDTAKVVKAEQE